MEDIPPLGPPRLRQRLLCPTQGGVRRGESFQTTLSSGEERSGAGGRNDGIPAPALRSAELRKTEDAAPLSSDRRIDR